MKDKQTIKCNVETCKYNNEKRRLCNLDTINVSCSCDHDDCECKKETICDSFEKKEI